MHKLHTNRRGDGDFVMKEFEAAVGFSRHLGIGFNVIGRLDIFERFTICFDESEKMIEFFPKSG